MVLNEKRVKNKWADYLITAVRYKRGTNNSVIEYFKVYRDNIVDLEDGRTWSKDELIKALKDGKSFATVIQEADDKWIKVHDLSIYFMEGLFIRTDPNTVYGDSLGNIETF